MGGSAEVLDDLDEFVGLVALGTRIAEEISGAFDDGGLLRGAGDSDPAATTELEQSFVAELAKGPQDGVGIDAENRG